MKTIKIGNMSTSAISLGCMRMSGLDAKGVDAIMDEALQNEINYFDHADIYGGGNSEKLFGEYLQKHNNVRDKIFIQTKCAIHDGQFDFSKEHIIKSVEGSLSRLGVDYVDALLLHRPDTLMEPEEVAEAFDILREQGKVRAFGVSNFSAMQMQLFEYAGIEI
ncbi:MAG: aldo/keto reductase, partial [Clostridia bacterium]|nr:aldo/keto reductase [Clostridia bacterium]